MQIQADLPTLTAVLEEMAQEFAQLYTENLTKHDRLAAGELIRAVASTRVVVDGTTYEVSVDLPQYWKYVDTGTRGRNTGLPSRKFPPFSKILNWVRVKPSLPRPLTIDGKPVSDERFAGKVAGKIMWYGTKGTHDFEDAQREVIEKYKDRIAEALGHDALYYIVKATA